MNPYDVRENARMTELDALDHALVRALQDDARQTNRDLAAAVHAAPSTSSERVRALRATGVIRGYHADVALEALGRRVQALIAVRIRPPSREHIEAFRDWAGACRRPSASSSSRAATTSCSTSPCPTPTRCTPSSSTGSPSAARSPTCARRSSTSTSAGRCSSRSVRIPEPDNHCASAILAYVQASSRRAGIAEELAAELLELWHHLMRGASQQLYGLIADARPLDHADEDAPRARRLRPRGLRQGARRPPRPLAPGRQPHGRRLLRRGWLERREDPTDRRMKRVGITPDGRKVIHRIETPASPASSSTPPR